MAVTKSNIPNVEIYASDDAGLVVLGTFVGSVPTTANVFAPGAILIKTDDTSTGVKVYENAGNSASPSFQITGGAPAFITAYAGNHTTVGGGAAEAITVTGALATDVVMATIKTVGGTPRTIVSAAATADTVTVTFSGDPSTDHVVAYQVLRAVA